MPICAPRMMPKRYSRPICAPESRPKKSSSRSLKSPWPSGRPNRCVTRNALLNCGRRSVVGNVMIVKSGCASRRSRSGSSSCAIAVAGASSPTIKTAAARIADHTCVLRRQAPAVTLDTVIIWLLVVARAKLDPAPDHLYLPGGQVGTVQWHPPPPDPVPPFEFVNEVTVLRVAGDDTYGAGFCPAGHPNQIRIGDSMCEIETGTVELTEGGIVTIRTRYPAARVTVLEDFALNAAERRDEVWRGPRDVGQRFIACGGANGHRHGQCPAEQTSTHGSPHRAPNVPRACLSYTSVLPPAEAR